MLVVLLKIDPEKMLVGIVILLALIIQSIRLKIPKKGQCKFCERPTRHKTSVLNVDVYICKKCEKKNEKSKESKKPDYRHPMLKVV